MKKIILPVLIIYMFAGCIHNNQNQFNLEFKKNSPANLKNAKILQVSSYDTTGGNNDRKNIQKGGKAIIFHQKGPGIITRIWFTIDSRDPDFLRNILIRMYWDGEEFPSVEVPVGDFFGCGFEYRHYTAQYLGMSSGGYYCYFPMPFNKSATIEVINDTDQEVFAFYYHINYYKLENDFDKNTGYFHAFWKRDIRTNYDSNYTVLEARGSGHFIGMNLHVQPYTPSLLYLEGDEMVFVDNETVPSIHGTGTEDYFSSGWYYKDGEFAADFHGLIMKDPVTGRTVSYRHHIPDPIPFNKSILFTIEHGHANEVIADYSSTAYWYQTEPHMPFPEILKASLRKKLKATLPNHMIEAEYLAETAVGNADFLPHDMSDYGPEWSGLTELQIKGKSGDSLLITISGLKESGYDLDMYYTKHPEYGKADVTFGGNTISTINCYSEEVVAGNKNRLKRLTCQNNELTLNFILKGNADEQIIIGIDAFKLHPLRKYIPEWNIIGPFPNKRDSDILRYGLDSVFPPEHEVILNKTYTGTNGQQINWEKIATPSEGYISLWDKVAPYEFAITYASCNIFSPGKQQVELLIGSDDGIKVFVNQEEVFRFLDVRISSPDQDVVPIVLKEGWNHMLLKIENNFGGYAFYARLCGLEYPVKYSTEQEF